VSPPDPPALMFPLPATPMISTLIRRSNQELSTPCLARTMQRVDSGRRLRDFGSPAAATIMSEAGTIHRSEDGQSAAALPRAFQTSIFSAISRASSTSTPR
jgi:hypothetical protein